MIRKPLLTVLTLLHITVGIMPMTAYSQNVNFDSERKKRDPFVALVNSNGKIKSTEELFPSVQRRPLSMNIALNAIIWDETRPLAMINNKVYSEGKEIAAGLIVEKINAKGVVLNDNGNIVTIYLRGAEKK